MKTSCSHTIIICPSYSRYFFFPGLPIPLSSVSDFYGTGDSSIVITNVSCSGDRDNIFDCQYSMITELDEDVGCNEVAVICQGNYHCCG